MVEKQEKDVIELKDTELEKVSGGLSAYFDGNTFTMYFSSSENPSEMMVDIKNSIQRQKGYYLHPNVSNVLQNLLDEMSNTGKTYLKINYTSNDDFITDISVIVMF